MRAFKAWSFWILVIALASLGFAVLMNVGLEQDHFFGMFMSLSAVGLAIWGAIRIVDRRRAAGSIRP